MRNIARRYFQDLFTSNGTSDAAHILVRAERVITHDMNAMLTTPYNEEEEVSAALKDMSLTKSPGDDGFLAFFYQKFWHIIGRDVSYFAYKYLMKV